jgi:fatty acid desaturase
MFSKLTWSWILLFLTSMTLAWFFEKQLGHPSESIQSIAVRLFLLWFAWVTWIPHLSEMLGYDSGGPRNKRNKRV